MPARRLDGQRGRRAAPARSRIPASPMPPRASSSASKPWPSSSIERRSPSAAAHEQDADSLRAGVLDDVRHRLLHDPVQRRLDLGGRRSSPSRDSSSTAIPVASVKVSTSRSSAATRPKSSSAFGRSSTASRRTSCKRRHDELAQASPSAAAVVLGVLDRLQAEQDRGERLAGLVVQLPREPPALELLPFDDAPQRVALDAPRKIDGDGRTLREVLGEPQVGVREAGIAPGSVVREHDARSGRRATSSGTYSPVTRAEPPRHLLHDLGVVEDGIDTLAPTALEHRTDLATREERLVEQVRSTSPMRSPRRATRPGPAARSRRCARRSARAAARRRAARAEAARARRRARR